MKVLIIDDEPLVRHELSFLLSQCDEVSEVFEGESFADAFKMLKPQPFGLLFLDIHLTGESGLDLAEKVNNVPNPPLIIFATAYDAHALKAFELNALDYVLKPFAFERIEKAVKKAYKHNVLRNERRQKNLQEKEALPIQMEERIYLVKFSDIQYLEVQDKKTTIFTTTENYTTSESLNHLEEKLQPDYFLRVHRSYIINKNNIKEIQPWFNQTIQLTMNNGGKVPVSRSYVKVFKEKIGL